MLFDSANSSNRILVIDDNVDIHDDFRTILVKSQANDSNRANLDALEDDIFGVELQNSNSAPASRGNVEYELDFASQGQEGLAKLKDAQSQDKPYFLAFVDMRMPPGWDGLETIEYLWAVDPELQVVICTAFSDYSQLEITERLGLNDNLLILKKPFDQEEVAQLFQKYDIILHNLEMETKIIFFIYILKSPSGESPDRRARISEYVSNSRNEIRNS